MDVEDRYRVSEGSRYMDGEERGRGRGRGRGSRLLISVARSRTWFVVVKLDNLAATFNNWLPSSDASRFKIPGILPISISKFIVALCIY